MTHATERIARISPASKATVRAYPGIMRRALILMFTAIPSRVALTQRYPYYQRWIAIRQQIIIKQSLNWCVIPTNLYLAYRRSKTKTYIFLFLGAPLSLP